MATKKPKAKRAKKAKPVKKPPAKKAKPAKPVKKAKPPRKATPSKKATPVIDRARFVKAEPHVSNSSSADSWRRPKQVSSSNVLTEFLGRLWALFGPPTGDNGKGYEYDLHDTLTGQIVNAYSAASGPSFGNAAGQRDDAVDALEALINATSPVDCETTVDYGASRIGIAKGKHFYEYDGPEDDSFAD